MIVTSCFIIFETTEIQSLISFPSFCSHEHLKGICNFFQHTLLEIDSSNSAQGQINYISNILLRKFLVNVSSIIMLNP